MGRKRKANDDLRPEYDFSKMRIVARGPKRKAPKLKVVHLEPDVARAFPVDEPVNVSTVDWYPFKNGESIGQTGSESGRILCDEEHADGARVTLEHVNDNRFTITCGIYGWMVHIRFFNSEPAAQVGYAETKDELVSILALIPLESEANDEKMRVATNAIADFVDRCQ